MCQKFATCYSTVITLAQYEPIWHICLLFFYSSFSLFSQSISLSQPVFFLYLFPLQIRFLVPPSTGVGCDFGIEWFWWVWIFVGFGGGLWCRCVRLNPNQNHIVVWNYVVLHYCCRWSHWLVLHNSPPTSMHSPSYHANLATLFSTTCCRPLSIKLWVWDLGWCRWVWDLWLWPVVWCYGFGGNFS